MYDRIFGEGVDFARTERRRARRLRALGFARSDLARAQGRLPDQREGALLTHDAHLELLDMRARLHPDATCGDSVTRPTVGGETAKRDDTGLTQVATAQMDLLVAALRCGLTSVATFQLLFPGSDARVPGVEGGVAYIMANATRDTRRLVNRFMIEQIAYLLGQLESVSVGSNRTLLDETLVLCASEMADGNHKNHPLPVIVAGGGGDTFRLGQWVNLANRPRHTKLLTSIVHAFGMTHIGTIGEWDDAGSQGPLLELQG